MGERVSVVIATCGRPEKLGRCLSALARQVLPRGVELEVVVAIDGGDTSGAYARLDRPENTRFLSLPRVGIGAARNAAIGVATGDWLLSTNDDTYAEPNWIAEHLAGQAARREPGLVLGLTTWRSWPDPTVFDALVRDTSMLFFYDRMRGNRLYGFRHFWTCNASLPMKLARAAGGFNEALRPYGFEDLEFAFRVERAGPGGVYFHPASANVHDHRMQWRDYCRREACLGRMAACLWEVNPACFEATYGRSDALAMRDEFAAWLRLDRGDHGRLAEEMRRWAAVPLSEIGDWQRVCPLLYRMHLPLKRRCFRAGFVSAFDLRHDSRWLDRLSKGHSFP